MKSFSQYLLIGPLPPPVNGQSLCFATLISGLENHVLVDRNVDQFKLIRKLRVFSKAYFKSLYHILFGNVSSTYISVSRSWPGTVFDTSIILLSKIMSNRIILHLHGNDFLKNSLKRKLFSWVYSKADCFIALSEPMKIYLESIVNCPIQVIVNPIQDFFFEEKRAESVTGTIRIVYMSNIMFSKGVFNFLKLASDFQADGNCSKYEYHVIGKFLGDNDMTAKEVKKQFDAYIGDLSNTTFHGPLYGPDLARTLVSMDILVFPSFYPVEALPLSILEAAAVGIYVIVNDHNDLEVFKTLLPNVWLSDTSKSNQVMKHIVRLSKTQIAQMGAQNAAKAKCYSTKNHVAKVKSVLYTK